MLDFSEKDESYTQSLDLEFSAEFYDFISNLDSPLRLGSPLLIESKEEEKEEEKNEYDLSNLRSLEDYAEGLGKYCPKKDTPIYFGKLYPKYPLSPWQCVSFYREKQAAEQIKGLSLWPEGRNDAWSYARNMAFMLGGIEARRTFILVTPKEHYNHDYITYTIDELLWLQDNGYTFHYNNFNETTTCLPPKEPYLNITMREYRDKSGKTPEELKDEINARRRKILNFPEKREVLFSSKSQNYFPKRESSSSSAYPPNKKRKMGVL